MFLSSLKPLRIGYVIMSYNKSFLRQSQKIFAQERKKAGKIIAKSAYSV